MHLKACKSFHLCRRSNLDDFWSAGQTLDLRVWGKKAWFLKNSLKKGANLSANIKIGAFDEEIRQAKR